LVQDLRHDSAYQNGYHGEKDGGVHDATRRATAINSPHSGMMESPSMT